MRRPTPDIWILAILILAAIFAIAVRAKAGEPDWKLEALQARRLAIVQERAYLQERFINITNLLQDVEKQIQEHMSKAEKIEEPKIKTPTEGGK